MNNIPLVGGGLVRLRNVLFFLDVFDFVMSAASPSSSETKGYGFPSIFIHSNQNKYNGEGLFV